MTPNQNFALIAGESKQLQVSVLDAVNLQTATITWEAIPVAGGAPVITKTTGAGIVATGPNSFVVTINPSDTQGLAPGTYNHAAKVVNDSGNTSYVFQGTMTVTAPLF